MLQANFSAPILEHAHGYVTRAGLRAALGQSAAVLQHLH